MLSHLIFHSLRRRLAEGFRFAVGSNGILNVAREVAMEKDQSCLAQFVSFPPVAVSASPRPTQSVSPNKYARSRKRSR